MPFWINILVGLLAFVIAALGGKALLPWLHKLKFGQPIKVNFGPSWHANKQEPHHGRHPVHRGQHRGDRRGLCAVPSVRHD